MKKITVIGLLVLLLLQSSCMSKKNYYLLQGDYNMKEAAANYEPIIQKDDRVSITVSALQSDLAQPFNMNSGTNTVNANNVNAGYLVDSNGNIDFPVLGKINVAGYTIEQLKLMLKDKLKTYLVDPVINIRLINFKVTVLGAVGSPGVKDFDTNRVTFLDAIAASGDINPYGIRTNILIVRDYQGVKSFHHVDITKADFVNSPYFYLDQNDLIYVQERKAKVDATALPSLPLIISVFSFVTTVILLITR